jgi:hypothetical protein
MKNNEEALADMLDMCNGEDKGTQPVVVVGYAILALIEEVRLLREAFERAHPSQAVPGRGPIEPGRSRA